MTSTEAPINTDDMLLIHRVLRREIGQLPRLFRAAAGNVQRAKVVAAHAREMLDFLHVHHEGEDELLYPLLRERATLDGALIERMDAQHKQVAEAVDAVCADLPNWSVSADAPTGERMAATIERMLPTLTEHLAEEEAQLLPIVARTIAKGEWDKLGEHGFAAIPGKRRLVILGHILEEADSAERARFIKNVPPPARVAYRLIGRRQFVRETATIRG